MPKFNITGSVSEENYDFVHGEASKLPFTKAGKPPVSMALNRILDRARVPVKLEDRIAPEVEREHRPIIVESNDPETVEAVQSYINTTKNIEVTTPTTITIKPDIIEDLRKKLQMQPLKDKKSHARAQEEEDVPRAPRHSTDSE